MTAKKAPAKKAAPAKKEAAKKAAPAKKEAAPKAEKKAPAKKEAKKDDGYDKHLPYFENITSKYDKKADEAVVMAITKYLGASLSNKDAKYVACGDESERNSVRDAFLKKKLKAAKQRMKDRVTFYYLLAKNEGKLGDL